MRGLGHQDPPPKRLEALLLQLPDTAHHWYVVSVNRQLESQLATWIRQRRPQDAYTLLAPSHFTQEVDVRQPQRVGTDRLAAAVAVNELRSPERAAIVVDAGTAVTVDVVTSDGVFRGGAILPGIETAAEALANATDALPLVEHSDLSSTPTPIGKSTEESIRSGIVWGSVGAVRELISQISAEIPSATEVYCTGGDGLHLARLIGREMKFDPNLVLRGAALTGFRQLPR
jgi:type III pantothenate kinase